MTENEIYETLRSFVSQRDWDKFHTPENLAKSISIEASELLELFQWEAPRTLESVRDELADVLTYCYLLAMKINADPKDLIREKLEKTAAKYPVDKSKGVSTKYDKL
jgi:NTP pyrophosphatase (non-canonical NTP hydrolase)